MPDPDPPHDCARHFQLLKRLGLTFTYTADPLPCPALHVPEYDLVVISPGYQDQDYADAADWLLSELPAVRATA